MDSKPTEPELKTYYEQIKSDLKVEHLEYLTKHPEVKEFLNDFLTSVVLHQPESIYKYAQEYFKFAKKSDQNSLYEPLVICGPSGVGKGTLVKYLLSKYSDQFSLSTSYTTRQPRTGEQHGREYYFVSKEYFYEEVAKNSFLEYCEVHGNLYGTHKDLVKQIRDQKKICILEIDVVGAQKISKSGYECNYLFVEPPSMEELKHRLVTRGTENEAQIEKRVKGGEVEIKVAHEDKLFSNTLVNDDLEKAKRSLIDFINKHYECLSLTY